LLTALLQALRVRLYQLVVISLRSAIAPGSSLEQISLVNNLLGTEVTNTASLYGIAN
jgi:hypothetical protein